MTDNAAADAGTATSTDTAASKGAPDTSGGDQGWKAPENKAAVDKLISDAIAAETAKFKPPEKYEGLKLSDKITVDPALVERTAATARALGLSQENAQKALDFVSSEAARESAAQLSAYAPPSDDNPEGGAKWKEQNESWKAASLKDKDLGNGNPEQLKASIELAGRVLKKFGDTESINFLDSALGSNPAMLRILVRIGKAMKESDLVIVPQGQKGEKKPEHIMYNEDGSPRQPAGKT